MSSYIPPDFVASIVAKLPTRDALRWKCICKSWYDFITSPFFMYLHLKLSNAQSSRSRVILCVSNNGRRRYSVYRDNQTFEEITELILPIRHNYPISDILLSGSSNGVLCFSAYYNALDRIFVWNPSLGKLLLLPRFNAGKLYPGDLCHVGFGFIPSTKNFKVIRIVYTTACLILKAPPKIEVYESSMVAWRSLDASEFRCILKPDYGQALLNGRVHWSAFGGRSGESVLSYDLTTDQFKTFMLPKFAQNEVPSGVVGAVCTMKEELCVMIHTRIISSIFVMKQYGDEDSWTEFFRYDQTRFVPLYLRENGEILGKKKGGDDGNVNEWHLMSCDANTDEYIDLGVSEDGSFFSAAYAYEDSLFLLDPRKSIVRDDKVQQQVESRSSEAMYTQQAGTIRKNGVIVIKGRPCMVVDISSSETDKHGPPNCHFSVIDIFNGSKVKYVVPASHSCEIPHVKRTDYQLNDVFDDGFASFFIENGDTKRLPVQDTLLTQIVGFDAKDLFVTVMSAMGEEQIIGFRPKN